MIDSSMELNGGQGGMPSPGLTETAVSSSQENSTPVQTPAPERTYSKTELSDHIKRAKQDAIDTYRRQMVEQPQYIQQKYGDLPSQANQNTHQAPQGNDIQSLVSNAIRQERDAWNAENQQKFEAQQAQQIVGQFWQKVNAGKEKHTDFDAVTRGIELRNFPNTVYMLSQIVDNPADVLYEFGKNRMKLAQLENLSNYSFQDATVEAKRLAQSIKDRQAAETMRVPNEPLNQMRHTNVGLSGGPKDTAYYRNLYRNMGKK